MPRNALAFLAMTQYQLGEQEKARTILVRLREARKQPQWAGNPDTGTFPREAAELVEGEPGQPEP
jgi:hypothetical protein